VTFATMNAAGVSPFDRAIAAVPLARSPLTALLNDTMTTSSAI